MSYRSILVNLGIDDPIGPMVALGIDLAARHDARLVGFCAADAPLPMAGADGGAMAAEVWQQLKDDIGHRLQELHADFDGLTSAVKKVEWRQALGNPSRILAVASRTADLVVTAAPEGASTGDAYRSADPGSVVLQAGRPLLVVRKGAEQVAAKRIVVAWKDTREARRAVADALPLLKVAEHVMVATVSAAPDEWTRDGLADVVKFLASHRIAADTTLLTADDEGGKLSEFLNSWHTDIVVSGAYGHSRLREWVFGGVTRSLLDEVGVSRFMSS